MSVVISETTFPDRFFRSWVASHYDLDGDGILSDAECQAVTEINIINGNASYDFSGINAFQNLRFIHLECHSCSFTSVDFSLLSHLQELYVDRDQTYEWDLRSVTSIQKIHIQSDRARSAKFGPGVQEIYFSSRGSYGNYNFEIDISQCTNLRTLEIVWQSSDSEGNTLSIIGLENNTSLRSAAFRYCYVLETLSLNGCTALTDLTCDDCPDLVSMSLDGCSSLKNLFCTRCEKLRTLSVAGCSALEQLECSNCDLRPSLDVSSMTSLKYLDVHMTNLSSLVLGEKPDLTILRCFTDDSNQSNLYKIPISELDVSGCPCLPKETLSGISISYADGYGHLSAYCIMEDPDMPLEPADAVFAYDQRTRLIRYAAPVITANPVSITVASFDSATFTVAASSSGLSYQWQSNLNDGTGWHNVTQNGRRDSYVFDAYKSNTGTKYRCVVTNEAGSVTSQVATLTVLDPPVIVEQPSVPITAVGDSAMMSVTATGDDLSYQWQFSKDSEQTWKNIPSGGNLSEYSLEVADRHHGYSFRCIVSNAVRSVTSASCTLGVAIEPVITSQPSSMIVNTGSSSTFDFSCKGRYLIEEWEVSTDNGVHWNSTGNTGKIYRFTASKEQSGNLYRCKITCLAGDWEVITDAVALTVVDFPVILMQPENVYGQVGSTATFSVAASGDDLVYQWQQSIDNGSTWTDIVENAADTSYTFTIESGQNGNKYRCVVSNIGATVETQSSSLVIIEQPAITKNPSSVVVTAGKVVAFKVKASGGALAYQWQTRSGSAGDWTNITDSGSSSTYSFTATTEISGSQYRCVVTNPVGSATSKIVSCRIVFLPEITSQRKDVLHTVVGATAVFRITASGIGLSYQWESTLDPDSDTWENVSGEGVNEAYYVQVVSALDHVWYRCRVSNEAGTVVSYPTQLIIQYTPVILQQPSSIVVAEGASSSLQVSASGENLSYQWQVYSSTSSKWVDLQNGDNPSVYTFTGKTRNDGAQVQCVISNDAGSVVSDTVTITVISFPQIASSLEPVTYAKQGDNVLLTVQATGGQLQYQWQVSIDNGLNWINLSGQSTNQSYSFIAESNKDNYRYRCSVMNAVGTVVSTFTKLLIIFKPEITRQPNSAVVQYGRTVEFSVTAIGGNLVYLWEESTDNGETWKSTSTGRQASYSFIASVNHNGNQYRCIVSNDEGSATSDVASLRTTAEAPEDRPFITSQPISITVMYGKQATFFVRASGGNLLYQWEYSEDHGDTWNSVDNIGTLSSYSFIAELSQNGFQYRCIVTNSVASVTSLAATLAVTTTETDGDNSERALEYLPSEMAEEIQALKAFIGAGINLDEIAFGARTVETLHASVGRFGSTDPRYYEEIAESINELINILQR